MNKTELIERVAESTGKTKKESAQLVEAVLNSIAEALRNGEKVSLIGFGNFEVRERAARIGRNPQTGEPIEIGASKVPAFKPGKQLKEAVNWERLFPSGKTGGFFVGFRKKNCRLKGRWLPPGFVDGDRKNLG
jgi:DNA-binding protein HU-beta